MILSPSDRQPSKSQTSPISLDKGNCSLEYSNSSAPEEEEEKLSDTDSESEWDTPGPVPKV